MVTSLLTMTGWEAYLTPVAQVTNGCAIISLQGARCGTKGSWKATTAEEQNYAAILNNISTAGQRPLTYGGKKYIITRALEDTIMAQLGKNGLVLQKSKTVLVAGHFVEGQVMNSVSSKVAVVVGQLSQNGC